MTNASQVVVIEITIVTARRFNLELSPVLNERLGSRLRECIVRETELHASANTHARTRAHTHTHTHTHTHKHTERATESRRDTE